MEELRGEVPFNCIITGPTNCGKTKYLVDTLRGPFKDAFSTVILICPTFHMNETYRGIEGEIRDFHHFAPSVRDEDAIDDLLFHLKRVYSKRNTLIILDDCAVTKDVKRRSNMLVDLAFSGRHANLSTWVLTQQLTSIAKPFRSNAACGIAFYTTDVADMDAFFKEFGGSGVSAEERKALEGELERERYARLCFSRRHPFHKYVEVMTLKGEEGDGKHE